MNQTSRRTRWFQHLVLGFVFAVCAACAQAAIATPTPVIVTIAGATAMQPVLFDLTTEYSRQHPNVRFDLRGGGSTVGEERLRTGQIDLAASTLAAADSVTPTLALNGKLLLRIPIGLGGLTIIVHPTNDVSSLTMADLQALYSGRILDWSDLGSMNGEVLLVSREDGSGSRLLFEQRVMDDESVSLSAVVMPTSRAVVEFVGRNPQAIGYVSQAYVMPWLPPADMAGAENTEVNHASARTFVAELPAPAKPVRVIPINGLLPTLANVRDQSYPLIQPLYLVSRGEPQGQVRLFTDFVLTPAGQQIVARYHTPIR